MTSKELIEKRAYISDIVEMPEANSLIVIHEGTFLIKTEDCNIELNGKITYEWFPTPGIRFYAKSMNKNAELSNIELNNSDFVVIVNGFELGKGIITRFKSVETVDSSECTIYGIISGCAIIGDKSASIEKIRFTIPNLRYFLGLVVKPIPQKEYFYSCRLEFEDDDYQIIIDKCLDFENRKKKLDENGGFITLYNGELNIKKGKIDYSSAQDLLHCFNTFITFINGRRTSALFIQGITENVVKWTDYSSYKIDTYKWVRTWTVSTSVKAFNELWKRFRSIWKRSPDDKSFLVSSIHWYVEANNNAAYSEGSIILAQTALELIYNWWIVENKKMMLGKDSDNISVANKIRLILSQLNLPGSIPSTLTELQKFKKSRNAIDAPDAIVEIRNAIVHSRESNRRKLSEIDADAIGEALQVYIWYIELSLLCILEYDDGYFNRCSGELYEAKGIQKMPWKRDF